VPQNGVSTGLVPTLKNVIRIFPEFLLFLPRTFGTYRPMIEKKASPGSAAEPQKRLEVLYARRSAIDALIHSLQQYDRFRQKVEVFEKRKTA
jgi:hypothetical protein